MAPRKATIETLKEFYRYDPETGYFYRKPYLSPVGLSVGNHGYRTLTIDGKSYLQHRLAFFYMTGKWPVEIDHIDRDKLNNSWNNLREITRSGNSFNHPIRSDNTSGEPGVMFHSQIMRWRVRIANISLGTYPTKDEAIAVARAYRQSLNLPKKG